MGDLDADTAVEQRGEGRYRATLSRDWEIWGPNGGYLSVTLLRAAGAHTPCARPASIAVHYLSVADFGPLDLEVTTLRRGRRTESMRVSATQDGRPVAEALAWATDGGDGLVHDTTTPPEVPDPEGLPSAKELRDGPSPYVFWENFDERPIEWIFNWDERVPGPARCCWWLRFQPRGTFADPFLDAGRTLLLVDTFLWPAAVQAHTGPPTHLAPSLDVAVQFHDPGSDSEWLLAEAEAPTAREGLIGGTARIWSRDRRLLASGGGQLLCRPAPPLPT